MFPCVLIGASLRSRIVSAEGLDAPRPHGFDKSRMVELGLIAVGFRDLGQRGGEDVGLADVACNLGNVAAASVRASQRHSADPTPELERLAGERFDRHRRLICRTK